MTGVPLSEHTTMGVGGPALGFVALTDHRLLPAALDHALSRRWPVLVLGGGSNVVAADEGFPGLVVHVELTGVRFEGDGDRCTAIASAGEPWDGFVARCVERGLAGVECLGGIPGTVGATPVQNVGAYGQEVSSIITRVRAFDRTTSTVVDLDNRECEFAYRSSVFNERCRDRYVVLSVDYGLTPGGAPCLRYADLERHFSAWPSPPTLGQTREAVLAIRASKGMLIDVDDPDGKSAGSVFKNPIMAESKALEVEEAARRTGRLGATERLPRYAAGPGRVKVPAAWLIERAGFRKGHGSGAAGISSRHTLAIVNRGGASAAQIVGLMREIRSGVGQLFGVELLPEVVLVGFRDGL